MAKWKNIGGDGFNFELAIDGTNKGLFLDKTPLENRFGYKYGDVKIDKGKIHTNINLPNYLRKTNTIPFGLVDSIHLGSVLNDIEQGLNNVLYGKIDDDSDVMKSTAKSIECNITMRVMGNATCSQVLNLINRAFYEGTNLVYQRASVKCRYDKENETVIIKKKNYYTLKCYDKSLEQSREGNIVENGLLRIEIVMLDRLIRKLFVGKSTIRDVLTKKGLIRIIDEYKRIFIEDVINEHIKPCLSEVEKILFTSLVETGKQKETLVLYKEIIVDEQVLRKALIRWYKLNDNDEKSARQNASSYISRYKPKYGFPENIIDTIRAFSKLCK